MGRRYGDGDESLRVRGEDVLVPERQLPERSMGIGGETVSAHGIWEEEKYRNVGNIRGKLGQHGTTGRAS